MALSLIFGGHSFAAKYDILIRLGWKTPFILIQLFEVQKFLTKCQQCQFSNDLATHSDTELDSEVPIIKYQQHLKTECCKS